MRFEKKLIILGGENTAKGMLTLEHNAYGTFASLSAYNLPDLNSGEYAVGIKTEDKVFIRKLGSMGRILSRFSIEEADLSQVHCVIYETAVESPVLYGTNSKKKLWEGNMMDGIRSKKPEFLVTGVSPEPALELPEYSPREEKIENFFLDILPKDSMVYADGAVASVNYYPSEMNIEVTYSKREKDTDFTNPIDKAVNESLNAAKTQDAGAEKKTLPWRKTGGGKEAQAVSAAGENTKQALNEAPEEAPQQIYIEGVKEQKIETACKADEKNDYAAPQKAESIAAGEASAACDGGAVFSAPEAVAFSAVNREPSAFINSAAADKDASLRATGVPPLVSSGFVGVQSMELIFYEQIKGQLDALFNTNPRHEALEKMLPETRWAKIDYDHTGKYYVVGLVGAKPDYICYGVPARYTPEAPDELSGYCQWLPLDETKPEGEGFWLMFQDAVTGDSVRGGM